MDRPDYSISTPENVDLHLELAGLGNRVLACMVDTFLSWIAIAGVFLGAWLLFMAIKAAPLSGMAENLMYGFVIMVALFLAFCLLFGYNIFFEGIWQGQTPGKRLAQIRVIEQNGQPVSWPSVIIRNLVRVLDIGLALVGLLVMIIDRNERRLGDFAAGTLVIRERLPEISAAEIAVLDKGEIPKSTELMDVGRVSPEEYELLLSFLKRRNQMDRSQRPLVAQKLEEHFREKLQEPANGGDNAEAFLEKVYYAYQSRAE